MSAYISPTRALKYALVSLLQTITYDAGGGPEPAFALVTADPKEEFDQEPYCLVWRAKGRDEQAVVGQNDRTVGFSLILVLSLENGQRTQLQTSDFMDDLTELTLNCLDTADFTDALSDYQSSVHTYIMTAETNEPVIGESKGGAILISTIDIALRYTFDL
jgi:hypothetical protein